MATQTPHPVTHIFKEVNKGKYKTVQHYELVEVDKGASLLTEKINISKDQNYALSMPDYWLKVRQGKKWSRNLTGLFKTHIQGVYKGDFYNKRDLLLFKFSDNQETLTVYYFQNYFTRDISQVLNKIGFSYTIKKRGA